MRLLLLFYHLKQRVCSEINIEEIEKLADKVFIIKKRYENSIYKHRTLEQDIMYAFARNEFSNIISTENLGHECKIDCYKKGPITTSNITNLCKPLTGLVMLKDNVVVFNKVRLDLIDRLYNFLLHTISNDSETNDDVDKLFTHNASNESFYARHNISIAKITDSVSTREHFTLSSMCHNLLNFFYNFSNRFTNVISVFRKNKPETYSNKERFLIRYYLKSIELLLISTRYALELSFPSNDETYESIRPFIRHVKELHERFNCLLVIPEKTKFCLEKIKDIFDIYIVFGQLQKNLIAKDAYVIQNESHYQQKIIFDTKKMCLCPINHMEILQENLWHTNEPTSNTKHSLENLWFVHMRIMYSLNGCKSEMELKQNCVAFVDNLFENFYNDFTIPYFKVIIKAYEMEIYQMLVS